MYLQNMITTQNIKEATFRILYRRFTGQEIPTPIPHGISGSSGASTEGIQMVYNGYHLYISYLPWDWNCESNRKNNPAWEPEERKRGYTIAFSAMIKVKDKEKPYKITTEEFYLFRISMCENHIVVVTSKGTSQDDDHYLKPPDKEYKSRFYNYDDPHCFEQIEKYINRVIPILIRQRKRDWWLNFSYDYV